MSTKKIRCTWAENDPLMQTYHDEEWGAPDFDSRSLWETLMLEGFLGRAWHGSSCCASETPSAKHFTTSIPEAVVRIGEKDVLRLLDNPGIIRSRAKIEATNQGAHALISKCNRAASHFLISPGSLLKASRSRMSARFRPLPLSRKRSQRISNGAASNSSAPPSCTHGCRP